MILSVAVGRSEGTGSGRRVKGLFIFCLFEWTPSEKDKLASLLGFSFMSLAFLGMLVPGCSSTGCFMTKGSLGLFLFVSLFEWTPSEEDK